MFYTGKLLHVNDMFDMFVNIFNRSKTSCGQISINKQLRYEGILDIVVLCSIEVEKTFLFKCKNNVHKTNYT